MVKQAPRRARKSEEDPTAAQTRRQEIIDVAASMFARSGYHATSTQEVGEAVGMLKGSLYYYIRSKEDLLAAIIEEIQQVMMDNVEQARKAPGNALDRYRRFVELQTTSNLRMPEKLAVFHYDFRSLDRKARQAHMRVIDDYHAFLIGLVEEGQKASIICPDLDPKVITFMTDSFLTSLSRVQFGPAAGASASELAGGCATVLVDGMRCSPAKHKPGHRSGS